MRINDRLYPVIASVSASHTIVEIGAEQTVQAGDVATLFDWAEGSRPEDVAVGVRRVGLRPADAPQPAPAALCHEPGVEIPATGNGQRQRQTAETDGRRVPDTGYRIPFP